MANVHTSLLSFNRGEVAKAALARVDLEKLRLSAETQENWMPTVLGPMMLRPGLEYVGGTRNDLTCRLLPFVFSNSDLALLELTDSKLRVWLVDDSDETLITRTAVSTAVTSFDFSSSTGWTLSTSGSGAAATISVGKLNLESPTTGGYARALQQVTVAGADQGDVHGVRVTVDRGPVTIRIGSTSGGDEYVASTELDTGTHSLAFTPTANFYIELETTTAQKKIVDEVTIDSSGTLELPTSWDADDLPFIRYAQSGDIVYIACQGQQQRKIERRSSTSWSVSLYHADDGPFQVANITDITLTPSVLTGNGTLTASRNLFRSTNVGSLFRLFSEGQTVTASIAAQNTFSSAIRVTGVDNSRIFSYAITGTFVATVTLQRSFDSATSGFADVQAVTGTGSFDDGLDNSIVWYRIGVKTGDYTSGTVAITLTYAAGGGAGVCRVVGFTSRTVVDIEVLSAFSSLTATSNWSAADWSDVVGWPSALAFHDGRLFWAGRDKIWGSVSDAYASFDPDTEGDSGPINRSVGFGPVDIINWILPLSRLIVGREGSETSIRSSAFDEPLTPTNFTLKDCSTQGSAAVGAVKIDTRGVFVQQSNRRIYELAFNPEIQDYLPRDLTRLNPDIGVAGFEDLAVQRQPDTQLHFVRGDGEVPVLLHDPADDVEAWWRIVSDGASGIVESVAVLPGSLENRVYYGIKRTIGGSTKRFIERLARRDQCTGMPGARHADSHVMYSGVATTTITGLSHLNGQTVVVWGWNTTTPFTAELPDGTSVTVGKDLGTFTVSGGQIIGLASSVTNACVGLTYTAQFKSAKLAYGAQLGTALTQDKKINRLGLILQNTHYQGLEAGQDFDNLDPLPKVEEGATLDDDTVWTEFDYPVTAINGEWDTDSRLCLQAAAPRPCTVMAAVLDITTHES